MLLHCCNAVYIIMISLLETAIAESLLVRGTCTVHNSSSPGPTMTMTITQSMFISIACDYNFLSCYCCFCVQIVFLLTP